MIIKSFLSCARMFVFGICIHISYLKTSKVRYAPDIVFQVNLDDYKSIPNKDRIGFSIIDVRHKQGLSKYYDDYIEQYSKGNRITINKGYECCLMSFCEQEGDLQAINTIKSYLSPETLKNVSVYNYKGNFKEAMNLIASFNLFIAARFHANIIALLLILELCLSYIAKKRLTCLKILIWMTF